MLKKLIKGITPPFLWKIFRVFYYVVTSFPIAPKNTNQPIKIEKEYFGLEELDRKLIEYLDYNDGFFVELGANDGVTQSNTLHLEKFKGWTGILVEPIPHNYLNCLKSRSQETKVFAAACVSFEYSERFVEILYSDLMSVAPNLEIDIEYPELHAKEGLQYLDSIQSNFRFGAEARKLNDILVEASAPKVIDFLSLDVEGAEIEVLKGIDHEHFRFKYICVECRNLPKMRIFLAAKGYQLVDQLTFHDYLFHYVGKS